MQNLLKLCLLLSGLSLLGCGQGTPTQPPIDIQITPEPPSLKVHFQFTKAAADQGGEIRITYHTAPGKLVNNPIKIAGTGTVSLPTGVSFTSDSMNTATYTIDLRALLRTLKKDEATTYYSPYPNITNPRISAISFIRVYPSTGGGAPSFYDDSGAFPPPALQTKSLEEVNQISKLNGLLSVITPDEAGVPNQDIYTIVGPLGF